MKKKLFIPLLILGVISTAATTFKNDFFEIAKQIEIFTAAYKQININYVDEVNPAELMDVAITAMFDQLDPYTHYWNAQEVQQAQLVNLGNYTGIGASVETTQKAILIKSVYKNSPADKAGLQPGDQLIKIGETQIKDFNDDAGILLKGAPGTTVKLTFTRQGKPQTSTLKRGVFKEKLVPYYKLLGNEIGYIRLTKFGRTAAQEVKDALLELKAQGAQKLILDLRGNPGGLLSQAVDIANLFLAKDQLIVSTQSIVKKYNRTYLTKHEPVDTQMPIAVLVNGHSASASEIVSGSIQDLDRGVIVGARSFGKGLVQRVMPLKYGSQMKLTISRYYIPSGRCIQALDYWHRDAEGHAVRTQQKDYRAFKTEHGRTVYDGGGIMPDVKVASAELDELTKALLQQNIIFDFATQYRYKHQLTSPGAFKLTASDYQSFLSFVKTSDFEFLSKTEKALKAVQEAAIEEEVNAEMTAAYQALQQQLNRIYQEKLQAIKPQLEQQLTKAILEQYFYADGFYDYSLTHNPNILEAVQILKDESRYNSILKY